MAGHHHVEDLVADLRARGIRVTAARRLVLQTLVDAGADHLAADQIADRIHRTHPDLHVSTTYRTLDALEEAGMIVRAGLGDGPTTYHLADDHHHHAVCDGCGTTIELPDRLFAGVVRRLRDHHGFVAAPHHLTITGRCRSCASPT